MYGEGRGGEKSLKTVGDSAYSVLTYPGDMVPVSWSPSLNPNLPHPAPSGPRCLGKATGLEADLQAGVRGKL